MVQATTFIQRRGGKGSGEAEQRGDTVLGVTEPQGGGLVRSCAAPGEKRSEGQNGVAGKAPRKGRKRGKPHGRKSGATPRHVRGGANRRGGEKPRGRNMFGVGIRRADGGAARWSPGVDFAGDFDGGAIFDNPKRGSPASNRRTAEAGERQQRRRQRSRGSAAISSRCVVDPADGPRGSHRSRESEGR